MTVAEPKERVLYYVNDFFQRLKNLGCAKFREEKPKKTVELLCRNLFPNQLRDRMKERVEYDTTLEKDVKAFVKNLCD